MPPAVWSRSCAPCVRTVGWVLQLDASATSLPAMQLEDGDRLYIPARPTSVAVFGSVFSTGSFVFDEQRRVGDYLQLAGRAHARR